MEVTIPEDNHGETTENGDKEGDASTNDAPSDTDSSSDMPAPVEDNTVEKKTHELASSTSSKEKSARTAENPTEKALASTGSSPAVVVALTALFGAMGLAAALFRKKMVSDK